MTNNHHMNKIELETARAQDFYRYYHAFSRQSSDSTACNGDKQTSTSNLSSLASTPFHDPALVAFAEVGAFRLKARRAIISFFDRDWQYVLAEATCDPEDELWLGATMVARGNSCCEHTAELKPEMEPLGSDVVNVTVIPDLTKHETFCEKDFVTKKPNGRFYAGVPITTPRGFNIGAFCVLDDEPREGLTQKEIKLLREMSAAVMKHLERVRSTAEQQRAGNMVRGLGNFTSGRPGVGDRWYNESRRPSTLSSHPKSSEQHTTEVSQLDDSESFKQKSDPEELAPDSYEASHVPYKGSLSPHVVSTFRRAVGLIREALDVDGVLYLDASKSSFGGLVESPSVRSSSNTSYFSHTHARQGSTPKSSNGHYGMNEEREMISEIVSPGERYITDISSGILGLSTSKPHAWEVQMEQGLLSSLLQRYPRGKIWYFGETEDDDVKPQPEKPDTSMPQAFLDQGVFRTGTQMTERNALRSLFPGVRTLAFVGLYDSQRSRWFSGSIIWSCDPVRVFAAENELSYLSAFGDTLMAEVSRVNVKLADKAKADFISSISHELRSPLHGILGSVECLQETDLEPSQRDLLCTVKICGETLLDTVHHLLDHAKINTLVKDGHGSFQSTSFSKGVASLENDVNLSVLAEQAVETVFAGHTFVSANTSIVDQERTLTNGSYEMRLPNRPVSIALSFSNKPPDAWMFRTSAGSWRRVILNLVGNSLKYTEKGHVNVELDAAFSDTPDDDDTCKVTLTVSDTGKGIGDDFLQNHLFEPFRQEDFLMPGTGLGMSMCKEIVASLGGKIQVESKQGKGTIVRVVVDLVRSPQNDTTATELETLFATTMQWHNDMHVNFFGVDPLDQDHPVNKTTFALERTCKVWFGMDFARTLLPEKQADVYMTTQDVMAKILVSASFAEGGSETPFVVLKGPLIVLCDTASAAHAFNKEVNRSKIATGVVEFISQPCGPRKLSRALDLCLRAASIPPSPTIDHKSDELITKGIPDDSPLGIALSTTPSEYSTPMSPPRLRLSPPAWDKIVSRMTIPNQSTEPNNTRSPAPRWSSGSSHSGPTPEISSVMERAETKVLLVDDNTVNLKILATFMKKRGYACATASNGLEAFELYKSTATQSLAAAEATENGEMEPEDNDDSCSRVRPFSFILMDINMPIMDGFEATRQIRAFECSAGIPPVRVIALTGLASATAQQEAFGSGVDLFLTKPVRLKELTTIMNKRSKGD